MRLIDREDIRLALGDKTGWELHGGRGADTTGAGAADGSTVIDSSLYSLARDQHVRKGSVIGITESGNARRGERRYAAGVPSTAGAVTVSPVFGGQIGSGLRYEVWHPDAPHPDELDGFIDDALQESCWYWRLVPLTTLRGGDVGDELAVSGTNIIDTGDANAVIMAAGGGSPTITLPDISLPEAHARRAIRIASGAAAGVLQTLNEDVDPEFRQYREVRAILRVFPTSGNGASNDVARIVPYDVTNSAEIAVTPSDGLEWSHRGWGQVYASFTIPATCERLAYRLVVNDVDDTGDFAAIWTHDPQQTDFFLPRRIASKKDIGQLYEIQGDVFGRYTPHQYRGTMERRDIAGYGVGLRIDPPSSRWLWYYEKTNFPKLTTNPPAATDDDAQTWAALPWVRDAALVHAYRFLQDRDEKEHPDRWVRKLVQAEISLRAKQVKFGAEPMLVENSPRPRGRAITKV